MSSQSAPYLFTDHCAVMSGAEIALLRTAEAIPPGRVRVILGETGPLERRLISSNVSVDVIPLHQKVRTYSRNRVGATLSTLAAAWNTFMYAKVLRKNITDNQTRVVVSNSMKAHVYTALANWDRAFVHVPYLRDRLTTDFMSRWGVSLIRGLLQYRADGVIANSLSTLESAKLRNVASAVISSPIPRTTLRVPLDQRPSKRYLHVGRITPWKGQKLALEAFALVHAGDPEAYLTFAGAPLFGETAYLEELKAHAHALNVASQVKFLGHIDDVYAQMEKSGTFLHTSVIPEPFGQVVVQAMVVGLPVIASAEGGPAEVVSEGVNGLLFSPRSVQSLAGAMKRMGSGEVDRASLATMGIRTANRYDPSLIARRVTNFLEGLDRQ